MKNREMLPLNSSDSFNRNISTKILRYVEGYRAFLSIFCIFVHHRNFEPKMWWFLRNKSVSQKCCNLLYVQCDHRSGCELSFLVCTKTPNIGSKYLTQKILKSDHWYFVFTHPLWMFVSSVMLLMSAKTLKWPSSFSVQNYETILTMLIRLYLM